MNVIIPDWLYSKELDQGSGAYETLDPALRAILKKQIALLHEDWLPERREGGTFTRLADGGDSFASAKPLDWAMFILAEDYASPAGCIAALLPALMAGVKAVAICRLGNPKAPLHPALSAAFELLGREEIFALTAAQSARLAKDIMEQSPYGRMVVLGHETRGAHSLPAVLRIGLDGGPSLEPGVFSWLHPGAAVKPVRDGASYDAVITSTLDFYRDYPAPLVLGPGYEYFWRWPDLGPAFFQRKKFIVTRNPR